MDQLNFFEKLEEPNKPICPVCGNGFEKYKNKKFCSKKCFNKEYREANKDKIRLQKKEYSEANKDKIILRKKEWYEANKDKIILRTKEYNKANKDKIKEYKEANKDEIRSHKKKYKKANKDKIKEYTGKKYKTDNNFKLGIVLRNRINDSIKRKKGDKSNKTIDLIGCSIIEVKNHLEKQFKEGMTWENHGKNGWHIDHIIPCASFDLTDPEQQKKCFHYTNLQPLWAYENLSKGAKILENP